MDVRRLRAFVAVADERSFTRAAALLGIAQPAVSQQVRKLEQEVGADLLVRTSRSVELTPAGDMALGRIRLALGEIDAAIEEIGALQGVPRGRVSIGVTPTPGSVDLAGRLGAFRTAFPDVELTIREALTRDLVDDLLADRVDLALLTAGPRQRSADLTVDLVAREDLVLVVAPAHRLAARRRARLEDLVGEAFVGFPTGATIRDLLDERARASGIELRTSCTVGDPRTACALVARGLGITVLPESDARAAGTAVTVVALAPGAVLRHDVLLARRRGRRLGPAARALATAFTGDDVGA